MQFYFFFTGRRSNKKGNGGIQDWPSYPEAPAANGENQPSAFTGNDCTETIEENQLLKAKVIKKVVDILYTHLIS